MTKRYILTGAPGAGKTALIRQLEQLHFGVVEEAATDLIALEQAKGNLEPHTNPIFIEAITDLQCQRVSFAASQTGEIQFHDRSFFCTHALATFLGYSIPSSLDVALRRAIDDSVFMKRVFFVRLLGFVTPTAARRIGFDEARRFEDLHADTYNKFGFDLVPIDMGSVAERAAKIRAMI